MIFKGHKENAISPISLIDSGISILVRLSQPKKASDSMHVTELGMITLFKLLQTGNLQPVSNQYFIFSKSEIWSLSLMEHSKG